MKKTKVFIFTKYNYRGASSRVRTYQYLPYLKTHGFQFVVAPLLDDNYLKSLYTTGRRPLSSILRGYFRRISYLLTSFHYDLIWIEKELFPWLPALGEKLLKLARVPYVVDYDDAIFHQYDLHPNPLVRRFLGKKIDAVMQNAALVLVGNEYLASRATKAGARRVEILPSAVDLERYPKVRVRESEIFTIGWIGTPLTARYLQVIHPALQKVCKERNVRLMLVGSGPVKLEGIPTEIYPWSEESEVSLIQTFNVGIMPLLDTPWEQGKCGYKLIQYMACIKPVVASPVGVNKKIIDHGINGFLASTCDDWITALIKLQKDPSLRKRMGEAGRQKVEAEYSLQVTAPLLVKLLKSISK